MSMTPKEEFNQEVWEVLQKVERERLATEKGKSIEYNFPLRHFAGVGIIPQERQKKILYKLQEMGALRIRENPWEPPESTPYLFYLDLIQPSFRQTYQKFQKACDLNSYLNDLQQKTFKGEKKAPFSRIDDSEPVRGKAVIRSWAHSLTDAAYKGFSELLEDERQLLNKLLEICTPETKTVILWHPSRFAGNNPDHAGFNNVATIKELANAGVLPRLDANFNTKAKQYCFETNIDYRKLLERAEYLHDEIETLKSNNVFGKERQKKEILKKLKDRFDKYPQQEVFTYSEKILGPYRPYNHQRPLGSSLENPDPKRPDTRYRFMQTIRTLEKEGHFVVEDVEIDFYAEPEPTEEARNKARWAIGTDHKPTEFYPPEHCKVTLRVKRSTRYNQLINEIKQSQNSPVDLKKRYEETIKDIKSSKSTPKQKVKPYSLNEKILTIGDIKIKFSEAGRRIPYLKLLTKKKSYVYHSEVAEKIEGANNTLKNPKNTFYEVCRGIKARLLASRITDFLEFDYNKARINPLYKKSTK